LFAVSLVGTLAAVETAVALLTEEG